MRGDPARRAFSCASLQGSVVCLAAGVTLAHVSTVCGLRPMEMVRAFKGSTGLSPHQWLFQPCIHLALELLGFTPQHLLLPTFLEALLEILLLFGDLFLPLGQGIKLGQHIVGFLLLLIGGRGILRRFVLVLLGV